MPRQFCSTPAGQDPGLCLTQCPMGLAYAENRQLSYFVFQSSCLGFEAAWGRNPGIWMQGQRKQGPYLPVCPREALTFLTFLSGWNGHVINCFAGNILHRYWYLIAGVNSPSSQNTCNYYHTTEWQWTHWFLRVYKAVGWCGKDRCCKVQRETDNCTFWKSCTEQWRTDQKGKKKLQCLLDGKDSLWNEWEWCRKKIVLCS